MDFDTLWESTLAEAELHISRANFATWLKSSRLVDKQGGVFTVALPSNFAKEWVANKYYKLLLGIIRNLDGSVRKIDFVVSGSLTPQPKRVSVTEVNKFENRMGLEFRVDPETNLNPRYTIDSFIVGPSNEFAHAAANAVIQGVGTKYNPFFVYGGVVLGKTHLVQAIGNEIKRLYKEKMKPRYVSSEKFTSDIVWAIRNKRMDDIKKKYRSVDILIIDDIQFIGGKEKTEEEFFHVFNALYEQNKQIVISSDRPPQSIPTLEERLRSRFEGGLIADITYPEYETRVAIIRSKLQGRNVDLTETVVSLIAKQVKKNVREIEGVLNKIMFYKEVRGIEITEKIAEDVIEKSIKDFSRRISDGQILEAVSEFFNVPTKDILGRGRRKEVVEPRQVGMYLLRDILDMSYPYIGERFGRDHTTAIHAVDKINKEINKNSPLNQKILLIKELIYKS